MEPIVCTLEEYQRCYKAFYKWYQTTTTTTEGMDSFRESFVFLLLKSIEKKFQIRKRTRWSYVES